MPLPTIEMCRPYLDENNIDKIVDTSVLTDLCCYIYNVPVELRYIVLDYMDCPLLYKIYEMEIEKHKKGVYNMNEKEQPKIEKRYHIRQFAYIMSEYNCMYDVYIKSSDMTEERAHRLGFVHDPHRLGGWTSSPSYGSINPKWKDYGWNKCLYLDTSILTRKLLELIGEPEKVDGDLPLLEIDDYI
jgi:hypothetical protein